MASIRQLEIASLHPYVMVVEFVRPALVDSIQRRAMDGAAIESSIGSAFFDYRARQHPRKNERRHGSAPRHMDQHENPFQT